MIRHADLGTNKQERSKNIRSLIASRKIIFGGYSTYKVYGKLSCSAGKRIKEEHKVFFESEQEALNNGYRPCAYCMPEK